MNEIDAAARVAKLPGASALKDPARDLFEACGKPAQFGLEGHFAAFDLPEKTFTQNDPLRRGRPVDQEHGHLGVVVATGMNIRFCDCGRAQRAVDIEIGDSQAQLILDRRGREAGRRLIGNAIEDEITVVIREAHDRAVLARKPPAAAQRRDPAGEVGS